MYLYISKNSRTFEARNQMEQSISKFINQNKAQAIRCKSCNFCNPAGFAATWAIIYKISSDMRNQKNIPLPNHALQGNPPQNHPLRITKVECEGPDQFAIHVKVRNKSTTVIRFSNPDLLEKILKDLSKPLQQ